MLVPERVEVEEGLRVIITWEDGRRDQLTAAELRAGCSCAGCREPDGAARVEALLAAPERLRIANARLVGDYAVGFDFEPDRHRSGIFSYELLRSLAEGRRLRGGVTYGQESPAARAPAVRDG